MKRILLSIITSLLIFIPCKINAIEDTLNTEQFESLINNAFNYTAEVALLGINEYGYGSCSGVIIKNTLKESIVLTARHCLEMSKTVYVQGIKSINWTVDKNNDLGFIRVNQLIPEKTSAIIAENKLGYGDFVLHVGYPSFSPYISYGYNHLALPKIGVAKLKVLKGCSGGGIFDVNGKLAGIVITTSENMKMAGYEKLQDIKEFIKDNNLL